jgi:hypothetical protein
MPWGASDAKRHDKRASTPKKQRQWSDVANSGLSRGLSEGEAIREANGVIKKTGKSMSKMRGK